MDRVAVVNIPEFVQHGISPYLLFFDKLSIPDIRYVSVALGLAKDEIEHKNERKKYYEQGEEYLALGYYLTQISDQRGQEIFGSTEKLLGEISAIKDKGLIVEPFINKETWSIYNSSTVAWCEFDKLDNERIINAIKLSALDVCEVSTLKSSSKKIQIAEISNSFSKFDIAEMVFKSLPVPTKNIPIDEILSFREDSEVKANLSRFRKWTTGMLSTYENLAEIEDEYISTYQSYTDSIKRLDKKHSNTTMAIVSGIAANVVDNLTQLKLGSAVKSLFDYRLSRIEYEKAIKENRGYELEYVRRLEKTFSVEEAGNST